MFASYFRSLREQELVELDEPKTGAWVRVENPDKKELSALINDFELVEGHLNDALDPLEVPRLEVEGEIVYLFTRIPVKDDAAATTPILIAYTPANLITVCSRRLNVVDQWLSREPEITTTQKTKLILQILQQINASFVMQINGTSRQIRGIGQQLLTGEIGNKEITQLVTYEGILQDFMSSLLPTNAILTQLLSGRVIKFFEEDKELIEDLVLNTNQLVELCRSNLKTIVSLREASTTIMTNNLNRVIKLLTSLTVILMIPNLVTGLYGMNVHIPFSDHPLAFFGVLALIITSTIFTFYVFLRNRWL
ncbi:MAG: magnesium transporter CorA family protein [Patescibacteria group bacterium]